MLLSTFTPLLFFLVVAPTFLLLKVMLGSTSSRIPGFLSAMDFAKLMSSMKFQSVYTRFIAGEDIGDSTRARRGFMADQPAERVHCHVVAGPVGDPLTSFRSRKEFVKVLLDCVECKSGVQY